MVYLTLRITRRDFVLVMTGNHEDQVHAQWLEQYSLDDAVWWWSGCSTALCGMELLELLDPRSRLTSTVS